MLEPFAHAQDVADRWRPLTSAEEPVAELLVRDASAVIRARFPGIDGQVASGQVSADVLEIVVANMVKRAMIAPADGISQASEAMGPFSHSQSYANPLGNVFLTAAETTLILGYQPSGMSVGFANDTTRTSGDAYSRVYGW
jgi:hypothetical protein